MNKIDEKIKALDKRFDGMREYLQLKVQQGDWHGVADAAMDIREILAEKKGLEDYKEFLTCTSNS